MKYSNTTLVSIQNQKEQLQNYDPERNRHNVFIKGGRKIDRLPEPQKIFSQNPLTKLLQPGDHQAQRCNDKLMISDIPGSQVDVQKKLKFIRGRDYMDLNDVQGAKPRILKQNQGYLKPDLHFVQDINQKGEYQKWQSRRSPNPLEPTYEISSVSGRKVHLIGPIEKSRPSLIQTNSPKKKFQFSVLSSPQNFDGVIQYDGAEKIAYQQELNGQHRFESNLRAALYYQDASRCTSNLEARSRQIDRSGKKHYQVESNNPILLPADQDIQTIVKPQKQTLDPKPIIKKLQPNVGFQLPDTEQKFPSRQQTVFQTAGSSSVLDQYKQTHLRVQQSLSMKQLNSFIPLTSNKTYGHTPIFMKSPSEKADFYNMAKQLSPSEFSAKKSFQTINLL